MKKSSKKLNFSFYVSIPLTTTLPFTTTTLAQGETTEPGLEITPEVPTQPAQICENDSDCELPNGCLK